MMKYVLGIDVGGTNIKLGLIDHSGKIISRSLLKTKNYIEDRKALIDALIEGARSFLSKHHLSSQNFSGIGMGFPGLVDPVAGIVRVLPNIPGWKNVPIQSIVKRALRIPTFLENDVNLIALGEWRYGAGRGVRNMICITLGTGVGGGLILNNALYRGEGFAAGEIGHIVLNERGPSCNCGGRGCFETYAGYEHLRLKTYRLFKKKDITLEDIQIMADQGNRKALAFWEETAVHIGNALTGIVNLLNPTRIVIGGGISNCHRYLFGTIRKTLKDKAMSVQGSMVKVVRARLGNDAGIMGAEVLVKEGRIK